MLKGKGRIHKSVIIFNIFSLIKTDSNHQLSSTDLEVNVRQHQRVMQSRTENMKICEWEKTITTLKTDDPDIKEKIFTNPVILETIFRHLQPSDIKSAALVNTNWRDLLAQPRFWTWATARLAKENFEEIFPSRRFCCISSARSYKDQLGDFISPDQARSLFTSIVGNRDLRLRTLTLSAMDLQSLSPETLTAAITRLERVNLEYALITDQQREALFTSIWKSGDLRVIQLDLSFMDLRSVSPLVLAGALTRLEEVSLDFCLLTYHQASEITRAITQTGELRPTMTCDGVCLCEI